ncbi:fibrillin-2-like [Paramuricea clavata]|uniref:Fibrillin-2-like, partial n=1 Tax=Paramuricea clavata TaxID=317549 RepID=A0A6S7HWI2_PARCT|nr:fibrillin-2-like [Paramuricea clavata]
MVFIFIVFDPCAQNNCDGNAECTANEDNSFNCTCNSGYSGNGTFCEGEFVVVRFKSLKSEYDEHPWMILMNALMDSRAMEHIVMGNDHWRTGSAATLQALFTHIDECSNATSPCHADADCVNIPGNYTCVCKLGFSGDGQQNCVG